jgi:CDGSH iron-sulfur domain-containing protein 3
MPEPTIARRSPWFVKLEPGTYRWCSCGDSQGQPFCDGAHRGSGFEPVVFEVTEPCSRALCGCKHSVDEPWCDGTHREL